MNQTKITLSKKEKELITNSDWILTKNGIIKKVRGLFEQLQEKQVDFLRKEKDKLPPAILGVTPKISRGENYKGLPYLVLDNPRVFDKEDIMAIRTMFWWGNFISVTLHLSGKYKNVFQEKILESYSSINKAGFFVCVNPEQWEHHFEESNYSNVDQLSEPAFKKAINAGSFIKIAYKTPLEDWDHSDENLFNYFITMIKWLT